MRRLWMKLESQSGPVHVYVCDKVTHEDGDYCHAQYIEGTPAIIEVAYNDNTLVMEKFVFHELVHNTHDGLGSIEWSKIYGPVSEATFHKREEENATFLEHKLFETLKRNKLIRFPKPPSIK